MNDKWYIHHGDHHQGPVSSSELLHLKSLGIVKSNTLVWKEGAPSWHFFYEWPQLQDVQLPPIPEDHLELPPVPIEEDLPSIPEDDLPSIPEEKSQKVQASSAITWPKQETEKKEIKWSGKIIVASIFILVTAFSFYTYKTSRGFGQNFTGVSDYYLKKLQDVQKIEYDKTKNPEVFLALSAGAQGLWLSTNFPRDGRVNLHLSPLPQKIIGESDGLLIEGAAELRRGMAYFDGLKLRSGEFIPAGHYRFKVRIDVRGESEKTESEGVALIYAGNPEVFESGLQQYLQSVREKRLAPINELVEKYKTLSSLLSRLKEIYIDSLSQMKFGTEIKSFQQNYARNVAPILQEFIVNAAQEDYSQAPREIRGPSENFLEISKAMGLLAVEMEEETKKIRVIHQAESKRLIDFFTAKIEELNHQIQLTLSLLAQAREQFVSPATRPSGNSVK